MTDSQRVPSTLSPIIPSQRNDASCPTIFSQGRGSSVACQGYECGVAPDEVASGVCPSSGCEVPPGYRKRRPMRCQPSEDGHMFTDARGQPGGSVHKAIVIDDIEVLDRQQENTDNNPPRDGHSDRRVSSWMAADQRNDNCMSPNQVTDDDCSHGVSPSCHRCISVTSCTPAADIAQGVSRDELQSTMAVFQPGDSCELSCDWSSGELGGVSLQTLPSEGNTRWEQFVDGDDNPPTSCYRGRFVPSRPRDCHSPAPTYPQVPSRCNDTKVSRHEVSWTGDQLSREIVTECDNSAHDCTPPSGDRDKSFQRTGIRARFKAPSVARRESDGRVNHRGIISSESSFVRPAVTDPSVRYN